MEKRQIIRCSIKPALGERSRSITIPCADGSTYPAVVWVKSRLIVSLEESLGLEKIPGWLYVTYRHEVSPGVI